MSDWHLGSELARRYAAGLADSVLAASLEAHLMSCPACRERLADAVAADRLARIWDQVTHRLDAPPPMTHRILIRLGWLRPPNAPANHLRQWVERLRGWTRRGKEGSLHMRLLLAEVALFVAIAALAASVAIDHGRPGSDTTDAPPNAAPAYAVGRPGPTELPVVPSEPTLQPPLTLKSPSGGHRPEGPDTQYWANGEPPRRVVVDPGTVELFGRAVVETMSTAWGQQRVIPRVAVIYGNVDAWVYTNRDSHILIREQITISRIEGNVAVLSDGPPVGTPIAMLSMRSAWPSLHPAPWPTMSR